MKRKSKAVAVAAAAVAIAVAVATAAVMLKRSTRSDRKTTDSHIVGDKVLEMLLCLPVTGCGAMKSTPSFGTAARAAGPCSFRDEEAT